MADQTVVKSKPESGPTPTTGNQQDQTVSIGRSQLLIFSAIGLAVSFFLPWVRFLGGSLSGFELQKLGGAHRLLWLIPILSAITVIAGARKQSERAAGQLTGILPFCVALYWFSQIGGELLQMLSFGAYLSLIFGAALVILPRKLA